uniref:Putative endo-1,4-beta-xylanase A-like protein isoform X2 n=1 Tax=Pinctada fucata TaxID=50426 RepID=A0A194AL08_PINFU
MLSHGLKVRGHNMFWATDQHCPAWLFGMSHDQVLAEMKRHVNSMISHTKGKLQHWDVNNENLHGDFYERHTGNPDITNDMFSWIHTLEPGVKLFLNDFNVVTSPDVTTAIKNEALRMKSAGVPLYGIGVQAHFKSGIINIDSVKYRLDKVAEAGLPIWITEFTVTEADDTKQASALEDLLTLFYSHPAVEGILIWGFWDGAIFDPKAAITTGPQVTLRAAGHSYEKLVNNDWKTHLRRQITSKQPIHTKVFTGDYLLVTRHQGKIIHQQRFSVGKGGTTLTVHLQDNTHVSHIAFG